MEISVLQSLIDRTSNQIAEYETQITFEKDFQKSLESSSWAFDESLRTLKSYKQRLPKLVKIQKALKKEIANKVALKRIHRERNAVLQILWSEYL